jgi:rhamnogalacturonan endolyase
MVYDLDGDGRAEIACKTADGTVDGRGKVIGDPNADWREPDGATVRVFNRRHEQEEDRPSTGHILRGPEYFTIFDGLTGAALRHRRPTCRHAIRPKPIPPRASRGNLGRRDRQSPDRYLACIAYLDGVRPASSCAAATTRGPCSPRGTGATASSRSAGCSTAIRRSENKKYRGQGNHNLSVADVDGDGRDEIIYGAAVIDDDGRGSIRRAGVTATRCTSPITCPTIPASRFSISRSVSTRKG